LYEAVHPGHLTYHDQNVPVSPSIFERKVKAAWTQTPEGATACQRGRRGIGGKTCSRRDGEAAWRDHSIENDLKFLTNLRGAMPGVIPAFPSEGRSPRT
jgi:hypothetical protein